jgi:S-adenosylmethionine synthetase, N-terminal domain
MNRPRYTFTSESVSEGHPDKVCDYIADPILDDHLAQDPQAHVACEVLCKGPSVILAGESSSAVAVDYDGITREAIREIGYTDPTQEFHADGVRIQQFTRAQAPEIALGVGGRTLMQDFSWTQRHQIAAALYKSDWKLAVSLAPEQQRPALQKLCDEQSLAELAVLLDPATEGVLVDPEDARIPLHGLKPHCAY